MIAPWLMPQLLVRNVHESLVRKLKRQASLHGVSAEEEHRRILKESLSTPRAKSRTLMEFLLSDDGVVHPNIELDLSRGSEIETNREIAF